MSKKALPDHYQMVKLSDYPKACYELQLLLPWRYLLTYEGIRATQLYKLIQHATHFDVSTEKDYGVAIIATSIAAITSVHTIKISGYSIDFGFNEALANLARSAYIRTIDLSNNTLIENSCWVDILTPYVELKPNIHTLIMKSNSLIYQFNSVVTKLLELPNLTMLDLKYNNVNNWTDEHEVRYEQEKARIRETIKNHNDILNQNSPHASCLISSSDDVENLWIVGKCAVEFEL